MVTDDQPTSVQTIVVAHPATPLGLGRGTLTLRLVAPEGWNFAPDTLVQLHIVVPDHPEILEIAEQRVADASGEAILAVNIVTIVKPSGEVPVTEAGLQVDLKATLCWGGDSSLDVAAGASFSSRVALTSASAGDVTLDLPLPEPK